MIRRAFRLLPVAIALVGVAWAVLFFVLAPALPDRQTLWRPQHNPGITLLAADGEVVASRGAYNAAFVGVRELPPDLLQAVLATEDRRFYSHFGIDVIGLARALAVNLRAGGVVQGGSTITQQLAKNLFLGQERTIPRKLKELYLAIWLETQLTKDEILSLYLNRVYFGSGTYGVEAAARRYFGRSARDVDLLQAAVLAGLLRAPSRYAPMADVKRARDRASTVLDNMVAAGFLTGDARDRVRASRLQVAQPAGSRDIGYFVDWIEAQLPAIVGEGGRDLIVATTLDMQAQTAAEAAVSAALVRHGEARRIGEAALVALGPDGAVRAMVGGRSYLHSQFNRAVLGKRQPGSAFKPFVYLAALEAGRRPGDIVDDGPVAVGAWRPQNVDGRFHGRVSLRDALSRSLNVATVRLSEEVGRDRVVATARRLGLPVPQDPHPSVALGTAGASPLRLAQAYATFANGGMVAVPYVVLDVRDRRGAVLYRREAPSPRRLVGGSAVAAMNGMLAEAMRTGTGKAARLAGRESAGKTGTSQDYRDAWFVGYTADLVAAVWTGNDDDAPMRQVAGGGVPAEIWKSFMTAAHAGRPARSLPTGTGEDRPVAVADGAAREPVSDRAAGLVGSVLRWLGEVANAMPQDDYLADRPVEELRIEADTE